MLSHQQILYFRTFGYVVLPALLSVQEAADLAEEIRESLAAAFVDTGSDDSNGGLRSEFLPLSVRRAPLSQSLIADDRRLFGGSAQLLGRPTVPTIPIATRFRSNAAWHTDQGPDIGGVRFLSHLEPRTADDGALRVLPGSHDRSFAATVGSYFAEDPHRQGFDGWPVPAVVLETTPGDVIAFDAHLYHSSVGGQDRLAWFIDYLPWPGLGHPQSLAATRELIVDAVSYEGYDREQWPIWREWIEAPHPSTSRALAIERLRLLGVLDDQEGRA